MSVNTTETNTATAAQQPDQQPPKKPKKKVVRYREFHKRIFLNLPGKESDAYISVHLVNGWDNYTISITDCNEKITLHGSLKKLKSRKNALHKIDGIIETLQEFRGHITDEFKRHNLRS